MRERAWIREAKKWAKQYKQGTSQKEISEKYDVSPHELSKAITAVTVLPNTILRNSQWVKSVILELGCSSSAVIDWAMGLDSPPTVQELRKKKCPVEVPARATAIMDKVKAAGHKQAMLSNASGISIGKINRWSLDMDYPSNKEIDQLEVGLARLENESEPIESHRLLDLLKHTLGCFSRSCTRCRDALTVLDLVE